MDVILHNLHARVVNASTEERRFLVGYLTFADEKARYRTGGRRGRPKSQFIRLYNTLNDQFPSGYIALVHRAAKKEGITLHVDDRRTRPCIADPSADLAWLRDYQLEAVQHIHRRTRGLLWLPTGSGKTEIAAGLARSLPCRWLFLVHRTQLASDALERLHRRTGEVGGLIADGSWTVERFTAATFQTLARALNGQSGAQKQQAAAHLLSKVQGVIIDEAHTLPASSFWRVAMAMPAAYYRVGLSGTPLARGDKRSMYTIAATGPVLYRVLPELLIERGVLSRPRIRMCSIEQQSAAPTFQGVYGELIVRSARRNALLVRMAKRAAKPSLLFVKEIRHGREMLKRLEQAGLRAEFVWGDKAVEVRRAAIERLERGDTEVLITSVVFQEGIDIPDLESVIIGAGGKSVIATLQRIGRGMRVGSDGSTTFEVWDVYDEGNRMLQRHSKTRMKAYRSEGHDVEIVSGLAPAPRNQKQQEIVTDGDA